MNKTKVQTGVVHGRFQIFHNDHLKYVMAAKERCNHLIVGITNPDSLLTKDDPVDPVRSDPASNPLTYFERFLMIKNVLLGQGLSLMDFSIVPFPINYKELILNYTPKNATYFLTIYDDWGNKKLELLKSMDLEVEVLWKRALKNKTITSSDIRQKIKDGIPVDHLVPPSVVDDIKSFELRKRL